MSAAPAAAQSAAGSTVAFSRTGKRLLQLFFYGFIVFLYAPTLVLVIFSFNDSTVAAFPLAGFTSKWYSGAWAEPTIRDALVNSVKVATGVAIATTLVGTAVSYALARRGVRMRAAISAFLLVPIVVPTVVLGIALLILFMRGPIGLPLGLLAVAIGHCVIALPYAVLLLLPRISAVDKRLEEAAWDLGASQYTTFRKVVLPLIMPAVLSAFLISFVTSIDEVVIASFLVQDEVTYPIYLYGGLKFAERTMLLIPVATVMIAVSFAVVLAAEIVRRRGERRVGLELQ